MQPTIGRVVHFYEAENPRAAVVTAVEPGASGVVDLFVMAPGRDGFSLPSVPFSEEPLPGSWTWPPRA